MVRISIPTIYFIGLLFCFVLLDACTVPGEPPQNIIWFDRPATYFEEAIPLGNGRIGATVYGGILKEEILLNEATLWAGGPVDAHMNPEAFRNLPAIRKALFEENYPLADALVKKLQGKFSESYLPFGSLQLTFNHNDTIAGYSRLLDLKTGISRIAYSVDDTKFSREVFVSYPDQLLVVRLKADGPAHLDFSVGLKSQLVHTVAAESGLLTLAGRAPVHAEPNYRGDIPHAIVYDPIRGMRFTAIAELLSHDGIQEANDSLIFIKNTREAVLLVSLATSFNGIDKEPGTEGKDDQALARTYLEKARRRPVEELSARHTADFSALFERVVLDLGPDRFQGIPTDERLKQYASGAADNPLEALYFQFGRYLLISSSRPGGQPANLQGIWNPHLRPPWSSNYTTNINAEMNYWPAEVCNLPEMHEPLLDFIGTLPHSGRITAQTFYNCRGWCCSHNSDLWAMTNPVGDFGQGHPVWANWSMAGPWYCTHLWEHFQFTNDTTFLKQDAWPLMKGAAQFCLDFLTAGPDGYLVTAPSTSPENLYITDGGYTGATLYGSTADLAMIRQHFLNTRLAAGLVGGEQTFADSVESALNRLYPYQTGKKGNLQEWYHDWEDQDPQHRHLSHLFGLYPGNTISPEQTPGLAAAARRSLELRGDGGTGWSKAWKINLWARLLDGDQAYQMLRSHLTYTHPDPTKGYSGGGTYPNLWDAHPPFQIDGNFGGTAGIAEMLLQSHLGEIHLLPALPAAWEQGTVSGLKARGGHVVELEWAAGTLTQACVIAGKDGPVSIRYHDQVKTVEAIAGETIIFVK